jgi:ParB-like chromosome segregation protein Spo0J
MKNSKASSGVGRYELVPIEALIPYATNARTHSPEQVSQIAASIREFGFISPVIADADNGIIAGHGRVLAAQKLKLASVPCIRVEHLSETQKRAYILADNKLALNADWDDDLLRVEIAELKEENFDALLTGFSEQECEAILADIEFTPNLPDEDEDSEKERKFILTVTLQNEEQQESLFRELNGKGFKVKSS